MTGLKPLLVLALGAVAVAPPAIAGETPAHSWSTALVGSQEVPAADPDGGGTARITANSKTDTICFDLTVHGIATATAAHIHKGVSGVSGPVVVPLTAPADGHSKACVKADHAIVAAIVADPAGYYVNVHNADYPKGALRGQLP